MAGSELLPLESQTLAGAALPHASAQPDRRWKILRDARTGARFAAGAACGAWTGDAVLLGWSHGRATTLQACSGAAIALFMALSAAAVVGAGLGPLVVPLVREASRVLRPRATALASDGREMTATALAFASLAGALGWLGYRAAVAIALDFGRPDTTVVAVLAVAWALAGVVVLAWPGSHRMARTLVDACAQVRALRWLLSRAPRACLVAVPLAALPASAFVLAFWADLAQAPWRDAAPLGGLIAGLLSTRALAGGSRTRTWWLLSHAPLWVLWAVACFGFALATRLTPESNTTRALAFERTLSGRLGYAAWTAAFDFDRDGELSFFGGGDCAPFDPRRHAGAVEIPGNGVDEDCDGSDLIAADIRPRPARPVGQDRLPARPSLVLVTIDGLGAPRLAALGSTRSVMPHLDELAGRSTLFTRCFSQGPSTRLSFPSIFTSRYSSELVFEPGPRYPYSLAPSERQLQDVLDDAGYDTVAVLANEYFDRRRWGSLTRGFQRVDWSALGHGDHNAPQVTDAALRVLAEGGARPLYLWVHYYDAHAPYLEIPGAKYPMETDEALYEGELRFVDGELHRLIGAIDARSEPTYLVVTGDHSTVFHPDPRRKGHYGFDLHTATLHVPLVIHGPGLRTGRLDALVSTMDIAPTFAELARTSIPKAEGTSLMPELLAGAVDSKRTTFHEFYLPERLFHGSDPLEIVSLHSGTYNLVLNRLLGTYELYDFGDDYYEQQDLYEDLARSRDVLRLKAILSAYVAHADATTGAR